MENKTKKTIAAMVLAVVAVAVIGVGLHNITKAEAVPSSIGKIARRL